MRLLGIALQADDLRRIVPTLLHGDETSRTLAGRIASGLDRRVTLLALTSTSEAPSWTCWRIPATARNELRGVLADDLAHRRGLD